MSMRIDPRTFWFTIAALVGFSGVAAANNIYVGQSETGLANGQDCSNTKSVAYFNNKAYWVNSNPVGLQIGPGTTVHLCQTISTEMTVQGSGANGSPITILFEAGAKLSLPYCSNRDVNGCINLSNAGYIILDGGTNGVIENTANGSALGNQKDSVGILANGTHDSEIRNLAISNLYVHSSPTDEPDLSRSAAIYMVAINNLAIHNNTIHDCYWCLNYQFESSSTGVTIYSNEIYNVEHGIAFGGYGGGTVAGASIYRNYIHDYSNWDVSTGDFHHDGIHFYTNAGAVINGADIYNNTFGGDPGDYLTSHIYIEHDGSDVNNVHVYNNVVLAPPSNRSMNFGMMAFGPNTGTLVYNNTIQCGSQAGGYGAILEAGNTIFENNIVTGCWAAVAFYFQSPNVVVNYNTYANNNYVGYFLYNGTNLTALTDWQAASGQDANSRSVADAGLNAANGTLTGTSAAIGAGINLYSLGIGRLNLDKADIARPQSGAWDEGAYQFSSSTPGPPSPPSGLTVSVN